ERSGVFTRLEARLIHAAMSAGSPAAMYKRLADLYTQRAMQLATMKSRLAMPVFVLVLALLLQPLPTLVSGAIGLGGYIWKVLWPFFGLAALFYTGRWLWKYLLEESRDSRSAAFLVGIPVIGPLLVRRNIRDFLESLALMLEAGISMLDALPAALGTLEIGAIRTEFAKLRPRIEKGAGLAGALSSCEYLSPQNNAARLIDFVTTGEASGTLPEMLMRHTALETDAINDTYKQIADWVPRIFYAIIVLWMAYEILTSGALVSTVPRDL
ncbi:MAG: type II secretion system F family protein, partial [Usitatibacteraceae bacterium]